MGVKNRRTFSKEFKLDAIRYRNDHPELSLEDCAHNLDIGESTLAKWIRQFKDNPEDSFGGSGNYISEDAKEAAKLRKENKDLKDALEVLKKAISILND